MPPHLRPRKTQRLVQQPEVETEPEEIQPSRILNLPAELRLEIYRYVLQDATYHYVRLEIREDFKCSYSKYQGLDTPVALLSTCRLLHAEVMQWLQKRAMVNLVIDMMAGQSKRRPKSRRDWRTISTPPYCKTLTLVLMSWSDLGPVARHAALVEQVVRRMFGVCMVYKFLKLEEFRLHQEEGQDPLDTVKGLRSPDEVAEIEMQKTFVTKMFRNAARYREVVGQIKEIALRQRDRLYAPRPAWRSSNTHAKRPAQSST